MAGHIYKVRQGNEFIWGPPERPERPVPRFEKATSTTVAGRAEKTRVAADAAAAPREAGAAARARPSVEAAAAENRGLFRADE